MKAYWHYNLAGGLDVSGTLLNFYAVFSQVGSGFVFQTIFGILGVTAAVQAMGHAAADLRRRGPLQPAAWLRVYSLLVILAAAALFFAGKLPLGEARLNAFLNIPVSILIIDLLRRLRAAYPDSKIVIGTCVLLFAGVTGNVYTTLLGHYTDEDLPRKQQIYARTGGAIRLAKETGLPILVTPGVAFPYEKDKNLPDTGSTVPGDWILKTHPAYQFPDRIPVYPVADRQRAAFCLDTLASAAAVVTDGTSVSVLKRR
jgi:hypothetical protein